MFESLRCLSKVLGKALSCGVAVQVQAFAENHLMEDGVRSSDVLSDVPLMWRGKTPLHLALGDLDVAPVKTVSMQRSKGIRSGRA